MSAIAKYVAVLSTAIDRFCGPSWGAWLLVCLGAAAGGFADVCFKTGNGRGTWLLAGLAFYNLCALSWAQAIRRDGLVGGVSRATIAEATIGIGIVVIAAVSGGERPSLRAWIAFGLALLAAIVQP